MNKKIVNLFCQVSFVIVIFCGAQSVLADTLVVTSAPTSVTAGVNLSVTVKAYNTAGVNTAYNGDVTLTGANFSGAYTVTAVNGVANFTGANIQAKGKNNINATGTGGVTGSSSNKITTVLADVANKLVITNSPTTATGGSKLGEIRVMIADQFNNQLPSSASTYTVTAAIGTNTGGGTLSGTTALPAYGAIGRFANMSLNTAGTYTVVFSSSGLTSAETASIEVTTGSFYQIDLSGLTSETRGTANSPIVYATDKGGNYLLNTQLLSKKQILRERQQQSCVSGFF
ncbi:MAG: hypothetical protein HY843_08670 [Bdellovibrio sp.]|nr:hypothetical protein [Bdellovibrio sp.]